MRKSIIISFIIIPLFVCPRLTINGRDIIIHRQALEWDSRLYNSFSSLTTIHKPNSICDFSCPGAFFSRALIRALLSPSKILWPTKRSPRSEQIQGRTLKNICKALKGSTEPCLRSPLKKCPAIKCSLTNVIQSKKYFKTPDLFMLVPRTGIVQGSSWKISKNNGK